MVCSSNGLPSPWRHPYSSAKSNGLCVNNEDQVPKRGKSKLGDPPPTTYIIYGCALCWENKWSFFLSFFLSLEDTIISLIFVVTFWTCRVSHKKTPLFDPKRRNRFFEVLRARTLLINLKNIGDCIQVLTVQTIPVSTPLFIALKVVGNQKVGVSGMCQSVPICLGPLQSMFFSLSILSISVSAPVKQNE